MTVEFTYNNNYLFGKKIKKITIGGDFNEWKYNTYNMKYDSISQTWRLKKEIPPGKYCYKFFVNAEKWVIDPDCAYYEIAEDGIINSLLYHNIPNPQIKCLNKNVTGAKKIRFFSPKNGLLRYCINGSALKDNYVVTKPVSGIYRGKKGFFYEIGPFKSIEVIEGISYSIDNKESFWLPFKIETFGTEKIIKLKSKNILPDGTAKIYFPKNFSEKNSKQFPLVILLHGYGGSCYDDWLQSVIIKNLSDKYSFVLLWPDAKIKYKGENVQSWYIDYTHQKKLKMESYIINELIPYVEKKHTLSEIRYIGGISMGGYGALSLAYNNPTFFKKVAVFSAPLNLFLYKHLPLLKDLFNSKENQVNYNLLNKIKKMHKKVDFSILALCGDSEDGLINDNKNLFDFLKYEYNKKGNKSFLGGFYPGEHNILFWRKHLQKIMDFFAG